MESELISVIIPNSVTHIGNRAFTENIRTSVTMHGIKSNSKIWTLVNELLRIIQEELKY